MIHKEPQPECIYLGKGSRTEISRHKLVALAQLKKGEPPSFVPEILLRDNRDEEVNSEDCETPLHSPLTQHVSQAAGSTSLIFNYNATKTAETESAKNKVRHVSSFNFFLRNINQGWLGPNPVSRKLRSNQIAARGGW